MGDMKRAAAVRTTRLPTVIVSTGIAVTCIGVYIAVLATHSARALGTYYTNLSLLLCAAVFSALCIAEWFEFVDGRGWGRGTAVYHALVDVLVYPVHTNGVLVAILVSALIMQDFGLLGRNFEVNGGSATPELVLTAHHVVHFFPVIATNLWIMSHVPDLLFSEMHLATLRAPQRTLIVAWQVLGAPIFLGTWASVLSYHRVYETNIPIWIPLVIALIVIATLGLVRIALRALCVGLWKHIAYFAIKGISPLGKRVRF